MHHLGLTTIQQVIDLPRNVLPARFGSELLLRIDQALGKISEPLVPLQHQAPIAARMDFDGVVSSLEAIWAVFENLANQIIFQLARRGCGARQIEVHLLRAYAPTVCKQILLSRPSRDLKKLLELFRWAMEQEKAAEPRRHKGAKRSGKAKATTGRKIFLPPSPPPSHTLSETSLHDDGYIGMSLHVPVFERLDEQQISLLGQEQHIGQMELDRLLERLRIRLGEQAITQTALVESHLPEHAWQEIHNSPSHSEIKKEQRNKPGHKESKGSILPSDHPSHPLLPPCLRASPLFFLPPSLLPPKSSSWFLPRMMPKVAR